MPLSWYDVLLELNAAPGRRLRMQELGSRVVLSRSQASRVVDELARAGFACREPDRRDRRGSFAVLTDTGRQALRSAAPVYLAGIAEQFTAHLTDAELRVLSDGLARVLAAAEGDRPHPAEQAAAITTVRGLPGPTAPAAQDRPG
ncbi:MAG: MarR family transcriptional regulator [Nocardioidaceae bacterium]|nr:MarR family transcriptional regulator [Nocardioidaceae bacterium]